MSEKYTNRMIDDAINRAENEMFCNAGKAHEENRMPEMLKEHNEFMAHYEYDSCGAITYEEYLEGRLSSEMSKVEKAESSFAEWKDIAGKLAKEYACAKIMLYGILKIPNESDEFLATYRTLLNKDGKNE